MWKGYQEKPAIREFLEFMESRGVKFHVLHTSGHADVTTIAKLIEKTNPDFITPVHTENPGWFQRYDAQIILDVNEVCI